MQIEIFDAIHQQEKTNWWFAGRRRLILKFLSLCGTQPRPRILDMGCGTGAMLEDLAPIATGFGTDVAAVALQYCQQRGQRKVSFADGTRLPFRENTFDSIIAMDVIEHIEDDVGVLREFHRVCTGNGLVLITVPALPWLWTTRDERLAHKRRYRRGELMQRAQEAGFRVEKCSYYCAAMFPAFAAVVLWERLRRRTPDVKQDVPLPPAWLNMCLFRMLLAEQWLMRWVNYPVGVSLFCMLRKSPAATA